MNKIIMPEIILTVFEAIAVTLWLTKNNTFYLFNFSYIGISLALGTFLFIRGFRHVGLPDGRRCY